MTDEQSKSHWWIVENHPEFKVNPAQYFEILDIISNALETNNSKYEIRKRR